MGIRQFFKRSSAQRRISDRQNEAYQSSGFLKVEGLLTPNELDRFRLAVEALLTSDAPKLLNDTTFLQVVNTWQINSVLRELTLHPALHRMASSLAGVPLRLWHDQLLVKEPGPGRPTEFHQDFHRWPFKPGKQAITAWIALTEVPVERGCLCFIPGSHRLGPLPEHDLTDPRSLFQLRPELEWLERVVVPLRAGDCTFHHGCAAHMAFANQTESRRVGFAVIFIEDGMQFSGDPHIMTDPLGISVGAPIQGELFPLLGAR